MSSLVVSNFCKLVKASFVLLLFFFFKKLNHECRVVVPSLFPVYQLFPVNVRNPFSLNSARISPTQLDPQLLLLNWPGGFSSQLVSLLISGQEISFSHTAYIPGFGQPSPEISL